MKLVKFGGSSLSCGEAFSRVKHIVESDPERSVVVVSAPGKRFPEDNKITDLLYICHAHIHYRVGFDEIFNKISDRFREIAAFCGLSDADFPLEEQLSVIRESLNRKASADYIVSRGEFLNAKLLASFLHYDFVDAADWLYFGYDGRVDYERSYAALRALANAHSRMVIPGFYGVLPDGSYHLFSRGGSDVTGALAAAALGASCYENWTDVSGILMADPKIVSDPRPIERITFHELRELSYMGADVLHEDTVFPVRSANIPLYIRNTNRPEEPGTLIREAFDEESEEEKSRFITGIAGKKHYTILTVYKRHRNEDSTYLRRVLEITERYRLFVEHIPCSTDCFSLVIASKSLSHSLHALLADIERNCAPDDIRVVEGVSLIAVVGRRMVSGAGMAGRLFKKLGEAGINIRMIEQGADEISIILGVMDSEFKKAIQTLYDSFT